MAKAYTYTWLEHAIHFNAKINNNNNKNNNNSVVLLKNVNIHFDSVELS